MRKSRRWGSCSAAAVLWLMAAASWAQGPGFLRPPAIPPPPPGFSSPAGPPVVQPPSAVQPAGAPGHLAAAPGFLPGPGGAARVNPPGFPAPVAAPAAISAGNVPFIAPPAPGSSSPGRHDGANSGARSGLFHSEDHHFSFQPPADWAPMAPVDIGFIRQMSRIRYVTGYRKSAQVTPYLLVQVLPVPPGDPASGLEEFRKSVPGATYDDRRRMFQFRTTRPVPGGVISDLHSFLFVGRQEAVAIHCYEKASDHGIYEPTFQDIADSFQFDPGYDYGSRGLIDTLHSLFGQSPSGAGAANAPGPPMAGGPAPGAPGSGGPAGGPFFGKGAADGALIGGIAGALLTLVLKVTGRGQWLKRRCP